MKATYFLCQLFVSGISYQEINAETYKVGGGACFKNKSRIILIYFYPFSISQHVGKHSLLNMFTESGVRGLTTAVYHADDKRQDSAFYHLLPSGSDGKESACNAEVTGSIPGSGRS